MGAAIIFEGRTQARGCRWQSINAFSLAPVYVLLTCVDPVGPQRFPAVMTAGGRTGCKVQEAPRSASCDTD